MKYTLTLSEHHHKELIDLVIKEDGLEYPAIILCGRSSIANDLWDGGQEERFLSYQVLPIPQGEIISQSEAHVSWNTTTFRRALKICKDEDLAMCVVHSHPTGAMSYSKTDDENEPSLFKGIFNRNGAGKPHASMVLTRDGNLFGRIWNSNLKSEPLQLIRVLGNKFHFHYPDKFTTLPSDVFHRQQIAFGKSLNNDLSKLTIGIVGCGATGSATASLLARLGVGKLLLIDDDLIERTNLNRVHGSKASDADGGRPKIDVLGEVIAAMGIGCRVRGLKGWASSPRCIDAIRSCDIIFGCTDDNSGRIFLNRFAHFYLIPVFDMGIVIDLNKETESILKIRSMQGRLTVIITGNTCLLCQRIVDPTAASEESLKRSDPLGFQRLKEEGYVVGSGDPSPAVVTFTTEIACVAANELLNRIIQFKRDGAQNNLMRFFDQSVDRKPNSSPRTDCPICDSKSFWGRGDVLPFMDQAS